MKLSIFACILYSIISCGYCGLVIDFLGKVHQEVHTIVDKTVDTIGTVRRKIHEPFGIHEHKNGGINKNTPNVSKREELPSSTAKIDPYLEPIDENNNKHYDGYVPSDTKADGSHILNDSNSDQHFASILEPTPVKNVTNLDTNNLEDNVKNDPTLEKVSQENKESFSTISTPTANSILDINDVKLENILPVALYNNSYFNEVDLYAINAVRGNFPSNNDNKTDDSSNVEASTKPETRSHKAGMDQNMISGEMVFPDSKDDIRKKVKECPTGEVKSPDGICNQQIESNFVKKSNKLVESVFEGGCATGTRRALDGSCQPNVAWNRL